MLLVLVVVVELFALIVIVCGFFELVVAVIELLSIYVGVGIVGWVVLFFRRAIVV